MFQIEYFNLKTFPLLLLVLWIGDTTSISYHNSSYHDIVIDIRENVQLENCTKFLQNLEHTLTESSKILFDALDKRAYFANFIINLPESWPDNCMPFVAGRTIQQSEGLNSDLTIMQRHHLFDDRLWTQQSGGCGVAGDQIYASYGSFENSEAASKYFVREFAKYRFGVFDEIGFIEDQIYPQCYSSVDQKPHATGCSDNIFPLNGFCDQTTSDIRTIIHPKATTSLLFVPDKENIKRFCDDKTHNREAPTKQNVFCDRRSSMDVILSHEDFLETAENAVASQSVPLFSYRRRRLTRYVIIIDVTSDIQVRESWQFLRIALRKFLLFDLEDNTEVGIVLANSESDSNRILPITSLKEQPERDMSASFIPYGPSDTTGASGASACLSCAMETSFGMLDQRRQKFGPASHIVMIIAPGIEFQAEFSHWLSVAKASRTKIVTINYPSVARRRPLDNLAWQSGGIAFTVREQKLNSEKSILTTYFELATVLFHIADQYFEGPRHKLPIEIHRKQLRDMSRTSKSINQYRENRTISSSFYLDESLGASPTDFNIYTHNVEVPLIQSVQLLSPGGETFSQRSDKRMLVKQLTMIAKINTTGTWSYAIDRFNGNPQPHFVQVLATPINATASVVRTRAWFRRRAANVIVVYCEVRYGEYPIRSAVVDVRVTRPDIQCNIGGQPAQENIDSDAIDEEEYETTMLGRSCQQKFRLSDTGAGDPDVTKGDGIYSRYFSVSAGEWKFEITVEDNGQTAYSVDERGTEHLSRHCCGTEFPESSLRKQMHPFQRYLPPLTLRVDEEFRSEIDGKQPIMYGRIADLKAEQDGEGKVRFQWTSPDIGGQPAARYEVKYAKELNTLFDYFDNEAQFWDQEPPYPNEIGALTTYLLELDSHPAMHGETLYFALRPFRKGNSPHQFTAAPVSNPVQIKIPALKKHTINSNDEENRPNQTEDFNSNGKNSQTESGNNNNTANFSLKEAILVCAGFIVVLIGLILCCILGGYRKRRKSKLRNIEAENMATERRRQQEQPKNSDEKTNKILSPTKSSTAGSPLHYQLNEMLDDEEHNPRYFHVGIPIYETSDDLCLSSGSDEYVKHNGKRLSLIQSDNYLVISSQHYAGGEQTPLSIITPAGAFQRHLSPYESWSASQLLHEHEKRSSPMLVCEGAAPPVPPLPFIPNDTEGHEGALQHYIAKKNLKEIQKLNEPPLADTAAGGLPDKISTLGVAEVKRRRNVTMV